MKTAQESPRIIVADVVWTGDGRVLSPGVIEVEDGIIVDAHQLVGERPTGSHVIDLGEALVMPGLVNTHAHTPMSLMRGVAQGHSLLSMEGFLGVLRNREAHLTPDLVPASVAVSCADFVQHGTTSFADQYFYADEIAPTVIESGLRAAIAWGIVELGDDDARARELRSTAEFVSAMSGASDLVRGWVGPHAFFVDNQPDAMVAARDLAEKFGVGMHAHYSTSSEEDEYCAEHYGMSSLRKLVQMQMLDVPTILAHCNTVPVEELSLLAGTRASMAVIPSVAMQSGAPAAPVRDALDQGVNVTLGSDNVCNNTNVDLFEEMRMLGKLAAFTSRTPNNVTPDEILRIATRNGHKALGGAAVDGALAPGAVADLIALPLREIARGPIGAQSLEAALVYGTSGASVTDTMVAGRWLMRDKQLLTIDLKGQREQQQRDYDVLVGRMAGGADHGRQ
ncbi:amidohydrolase family protein [Microbacterium sp. NPDC076911]|uniref:amidohydrolase family protein n=1 Tax=Microbacterium sp. NPDC076911 TaxID=3154958 RepID=UPI00342AEFAF